MFSGKKIRRVDLNRDIQFLKMEINCLKSSVKALWEERNR